MSPRVALGLCVAKIIRSACPPDGDGLAAAEIKVEQAQAEWDLIVVDDESALIGRVDGDLAAQLASHQARRAWIDDFDQDPSTALSEHPEAWTPEEGEDEWLDSLISAFEDRPPTSILLGL